jgi:hypothetical protein
VDRSLTLDSAKDNTIPLGRWDYKEANSLALYKALGGRSTEANSLVLSKALGSKSTEANSLVLSKTLGSRHKEANSLVLSKTLSSTSKERVNQLVCQPSMTTELKETISVELPPCFGLNSPKRLASGVLLAQAMETPSPRRQQLPPLTNLPLRSPLVFSIRVC